MRAVCGAPWHVPREILVTCPDDGAPPLVKLNVELAELASAEIEIDASRVKDMDWQCVEGVDVAYGGASWRPQSIQGTGTRAALVRVENMTAMLGAVAIDERRRWRAATWSAQEGVVTVRLRGGCDVRRTLSRRAAEGTEKCIVELPAGRMFEIDVLADEEGERVHGVEFARASVLMERGSGEVSRRWLLRPSVLGIHRGLFAPFDVRWLSIQPESPLLPPVRKLRIPVEQDGSVASLTLTSSDVAFPGDRLTQLHPVLDGRPVEWASLSIVGVDGEAAGVKLSIRSTANAQGWYPLPQGRYVCHTYFGSTAVAKAEFRVGGVGREVVELELRGAR